MIISREIWSFTVISGRPGMTVFVFRRFYDFILSLRSDLGISFSFPSVFIFNSYNLSGGGEPHNVIEDAHR